MIIHFLIAYGNLSQAYLLHAAKDILTDSQEGGEDDANTRSWFVSTYSPANSSHSGLSFIDLFGRVVRRVGKEKGKRKFRKIRLLVPPFGKL